MESSKSAGFDECYFKERINDRARLIRIHTIVSIVKKKKGNQMLASWALIYSARSLFVVLDARLLILHVSI